MIAVLFFLAGFAAGCALIILLGICLSATHADRLASRMLGPASSDPDFDLAVLAVMDDDPTPCGRRHRS